MCKISDRPFQAFRWRAGPGGRYKTTIISYDVARVKNVCQACLVDMQFGLPVAVRDAVLQAGGTAEDMPLSDPNKDHYWQEQSRKFHRCCIGP